MTQKYIILGLIAIAFVAGSILTSTIAYANDHQNGTPFLQEEIEAIEQLVLELQDRFDNIEVTWDRVTDKPDELVIVSTICTTDQIPKWDGTQWNCSDSVSQADEAEIALKKLDCNLIRNLYIENDDGRYQFDITNGCDLTEIEFEHVNFSGAYLVGADFTGAEFDDVDFTNSNLSGADFTDSAIDDVDFTNSNLSGADFTDSTIVDVDFTGAFADPPCTGNEICNSIPLA